MPRGLIRCGRPHTAVTDAPAARWTKTPIVGEPSVAQAPDGGGQSLAHADSRCPVAAASDFPGFQLKGSAAAWILAEPAARASTASAAASTIESAPATSDRRA